MAALVTHGSCIWHLCVRALVTQRAVCVAALCVPVVSRLGRFTYGAILPKSGFIPRGENSEPYGKLLVLDLYFSTIYYLYAHFSVCCNVVFT